MPHRAAGVIGGGAPYTKNGWVGGIKIPLQGQSPCPTVSPSVKTFGFATSLVRGRLGGRIISALRCVTFMGFCRARCPHRAYSCSGSICVPSEDAADSPTWCGSFPLPKDEGVDVVLPLN